MKVIYDDSILKDMFAKGNETKGTMASLQLRPIEKAKIESAKKLFSTLSTELVTYDHVDSFETLMNKVMQ
ncbi:MAG: hypothetical protein RSI33_13200 [Clostridia bacterium]